LLCGVVAMVDGFRMYSFIPLLDAFVIFGCAGK